MEGTSLYMALLERWQAERDSSDLLPLRDAFFQSLRDYVEQVLEQSRAENTSDLQRQLLETELMNLRFMMESLLTMRVQKILTKLVEQNIDYDLLTRSERRFADQSSRNLRSVLMPVEDLFTPLETNGKSRLLLIRFLEEHPQLVGVDLKTYGPFKPDDLAALPAENARLIIRKNQAEPVEHGEIHHESS
jgi:DNA replication factor GINS